LASGVLAPNNRAAARAGAAERIDMAEVKHSRKFLGGRAQKITNQFLYLSSHSEIFAT
jgi:hypothetical protein